MRPLATTLIALAAGLGVTSASPEAAAPPLPGAMAGALTATQLTGPTEPHEFFFTRAVYTNTRQDWWGGPGSWATDFPKADRQFLVVLRRLAKLDAYEWENAVSLDDPALRRYPFVYALEVGYMRLTQPEIHGLRSYLDAGGFLVIDDFWGTREWQNFEYQMSLVLPGRPIEDVPPDDDLFRNFYNIEEVLQVPNIRNGIAGWGTSERDGYVPSVKGIRDDDGRLMVVINWNTDLGDAWEHAENPRYPLRYSTFAYEMGLNMIIYAMTR